MSNAELLRTETGYGRPGTRPDQPPKKLPIPGSENDLGSGVIGLDYVPGWVRAQTFPL